MRRSLVYWIPVLIWAVTIFLLSSQSSLPQIPERFLDTLLKKGSHFLEFAVLAWLLLRAFGTNPNQVPRIYLYSLGLAFLYAVSDEYHQSFIAQRTPSPGDVTIDTIGAAAASIVAWIRGRSRPAPG